MAVVAMLYGVVSGTSIWYPINLLASGFFPECDGPQHDRARRPSFAALLTAGAIHLVTSLLVGLLLWRDAPGARATTDSARRTDRARVLVGSAPRHSEHSSTHCCSGASIGSGSFFRRSHLAPSPGFVVVAAGTGPDVAGSFRWLSAWESNRPELSPGRTRSTVREEVQAGRGAADNGRCCGCV